MAAQIIPFDFEEQAVRVVMRDDAPWWVAADVCRVLEIGNPREAAARLDDDERQTINLNTVGIADGIRGNPNVTIINESGFYKLVLTSRKPAAKRFTKWVTAEVLPALRAKGRYEMPNAEAVREISTDRLLELLQSENELLRSKVPAPRAKRKPANPLSDEERLEILRLVEKGLSLSQIAKLTGRSTATISQLRSGLRVIDGGRG